MLGAESDLDRLMRDCTVGARNARNRANWTWRYHSRVRCADLRSPEEQCRYRTQLEQARAALANFRRTGPAAQVLSLSRYRDRKVRWLNECLGLTRH